MILPRSRWFLLVLGAVCLGGLSACSSDNTLAAQHADSDTQTVWGSRTPAGTAPINSPMQNNADAGPRR